MIWKLIGSVMAARDHSKRIKRVQDDAAELEKSVRAHFEQNLADMKPWRDHWRKDQP